MNGRPKAPVSHLFAVAGGSASGQLFSLNVLWQPPQAFLPMAPN